MTRKLVDPGENSEGFIDSLGMWKALTCWHNFVDITMSFLKYLKVGVFVGPLPVGWHLDKLMSIFPYYIVGKSDSLFRDYTENAKTNSENESIQDLEVSLSMLKY